MMLLAVGCMLVLAGLWLAWPPLAVIVAGAGAVALGLLMEVPDGSADRPAD